ncbi:LysE/ArgO family amino acid transporter [Arthrobacter mobilis]|uniref:LysE/ArgO family amino acid transporter n=1 Tax=Arthrobacter mobilis TaxID=2724944 RepID=UPI0028AC71F3|nr:LysE/ArgO family amino acid transporter [Arthrobacter mobilis]
MTTADILQSVVLGLGTGLALIVAIGAQNAFVLRQGIRGEHVAAVVLICAASDAVLIAAGILGIGTLVQVVPVALDVIRLAGAAFLAGYGVMAAKRAIRPGSLVAAAQAGRPGARAAVGTVLALTWLNPHVYLDTVLLLGSVASSQGEGRWLFGAGAMLGSVLWFCALGFGARLLRPVFARPGAWRILDGLIAVVMFTLGIRLAFGL